jgi:hypothetical protein
LIRETDNYLLKVFHFIFDNAGLRDWASQFGNAKVNELGPKNLNQLLSTSFEWWTLVGKFVPSSLQESSPDEDDDCAFEFKCKVCWMVASPVDHAQRKQAWDAYQKQVGMQQGKANELHVELGKAMNWIEAAQKDVGACEVEGERLIEEAKAKALEIQWAADTKVAAQVAEEQWLQKKYKTERRLHVMMQEKHFPLRNYLPESRSTGGSGDSSQGPSQGWSNARPHTPQDMQKQVEEDMYTVDWVTVGQISKQLKQVLEQHVLILVSTKKLNLLPHHPGREYDLLSPRR